MSDSPNGILPDKMEKLFVRRMQFITNLLIKTGITPNVITLLSLFMGLLAGIFLALHQLVPGLVSLILMGIFDILDGQLATSANLTSQFGAVLDSTVDRYSEAFVYMGMGIYFYRLGQPWWILIVSLILIGSFSTSYVRAKAESINHTCPTGVMQRSERIVALVVGILLPGLVLKTLLLFMAILTNYTTLQRVIFIRKAIKNAACSSIDA
ncbi:MAG: CDP-alcohol phosphatidyltransferase family protein [Actinobacteria bacterium]|nr:CDP-alcohol phosphatidyltransferase family protein [Actinomycetota bacterium]